MPHPKRRSSKTRKRIRRSHHSLDLSNPHTCPRCGAATRAHRVCDNCGHYGFQKGGSKGTEVLEREEY